MVFHPYFCQILITLYTKSIHPRSFPPFLLLEVAGFICCSFHLSFTHMLYILMERNLIRIFLRRKCAENFWQVCDWPSISLRHARKQLWFSNHELWGAGKHSIHNQFVLASLKANLLLYNDDACSLLKHMYCIVY